MRWVLLVMVTACGFAPASAGDDAHVIAIDASHCGDHVIQDPEECDDGNLAAGDGCDPTCHVEPAWSCDALARSCRRVTGLSFTAAESLDAGTTSNGGTAFTRPCATGSVIVGFDGYRSSDSTGIGTLRAQCAQVTFVSSGDLSWTSVQESPAQGNENSQNLGTTMCTNNAVVVGYVATTALYLQGLQLTCMPVSFVHNVLAFGTTTMEPTFGPAVGIQQPPSRCSPGEALASFNGRSGGVIDDFDPQCYAMAAITQ